MPNNTATVLSVPARSLLSELASLYSDLHKDFYGFRPRGMTRGWTVEDFEIEIDSVSLNCTVGPCDCCDCYGRVWANQFPTSGNGWALVTDDTEGAPERLAACYVKPGRYTPQTNVNSFEVWELLYHVNM